MNIWAKWYNLWDRIDAKGNPQEVLQDIAARYGEPWRYYHTLEHVAQSLEELEKTRDLCDNPDLVEFALWGHDIVYDPQSSTNEKRSAELTEYIARKIGLSVFFQMGAYGLVIATKHVKPPETPNEKLIIDVDLSILGKPADVYADVEKKIRAEYHIYSDEDFAKGRADILQSFLDRPHIYNTEHFRSKYEAKARKNLARAIERFTS